MRLLFISIIALWLGVTNAQVERNEKRITKTLFNNGYTREIELVSFSKQYLTFTRNPETGSAYKVDVDSGRIYRNGTGRKGRWIWIVIFKYNRNGLTLKQSVMLNNNKTKIIKQ